MTHRVVFLMFDGCTLLDASGPAEVLDQANRKGADYRLMFCSPTGDPVVTSVGLRCSVDSAARAIAEADTVVVPGSADLPVAVPDPMLGDAVRHLVDVVTSSPKGRVVSVCTGSFLLARVGLLSGRVAATHWEHIHRLQRQFPDIRVEENALYVRDGHVITSAGVSSGIDLALALIEDDYGPRLARDVARHLVVHLRRQGGQSQFSTALELPLPQAPSVRQVVATVTADPGAPFTVTSLAEIAHVSPRHLARLFRDELGVSPMQFVEASRVERAKNLLLAGTPVSETARRCGFTTDESLRRAFLRRLGLTPSDYRARFSTSV